MEIRTALCFVGVSGFEGVVIFGGVFKRNTFRNAIVEKWERGLKFSEGELSMVLLRGG